MKTLIATSVVLSERAVDGAKHLSIGSNTESIIIEFSPKLWEKLGNTAKWFFTQLAEEAATMTETKNEAAVNAVEKENETDVQV